MPRHCAVYGCNSNSAAALKVEGSTSTFRVPAAKKNLYEINLGRKLQDESFVCIKHFEEKYLRRCNPKNEASKPPRVTLTHHALPTLMLGTDKTNNSSGTQKTIKRLRKDPEERKIANEKLKEKEKKESMRRERDDQKINSIEDIKNNYQRLSNINVCDYKSWLFFPQINAVHFVKIQEPSKNGEIPTVCKCIAVNGDLSVDTFINAAPIAKCRLAQILGRTGICNTWDKLKNVLATVADLETTCEEDVKNQLMKVCREIEHIEERLKSDETEDDGLLGKLSFVREQIRNFSLASPKYTMNMMLFASSIFYAYPAAYRKLRETGFLILPHPSYLKRIEAQVTDQNAGFDPSHMEYIIGKCLSLEPKDRTIVLALDEIYCKAGFSYVGGKLQGRALNKEKTTAATTVQAFMIRSLYSTYKDVVALFPVTKMTSEELHDMILMVIRALHKAGFTVVAVTSDNNRVNRRAFEILCGGELKESIQHPVDPNLKLFIIFDSVHNFKNIRNNWINSLLPNHSFLFPDPNDFNVLRSASFGHIRTLYYYEKKDILKLAPGLSRKAVFPSNLERQNVMLVVKIFCDPCIAALEEYGGELPNCKDSDVEGTVIFMKTILRWWQIVNTKTTGIGKYKKNEFMEPIRDIDGVQIQFLQRFCDWLEKWDSFEFENTNEENIIGKRKRKRLGKLTAETHFALLHSTRTLIALAKYTLTTLGQELLLLGILETDFLERRFGRYRTMNGCCYQVSVAQILQSERKLKVMSILKLRKHEGAAKLSLKLLRDKACSSDTSKEFNTPEDLQRLESAVSDCHELILKRRELSVVVVIAGYAAFKTCRKTTCKTCIETLTDGSELRAEVGPGAMSYFDRLDRGGLKKPSDLLFNLALYAYKLFNTLISEKYEKIFSVCNNQKFMFIDLVQNLFGMFDVDDKHCSSCQLSVSKLLLKCVTNFSNIFLNNYRKNLTDALDKLTSNKNKIKNRKLETLKKPSVQVEEVGDEDNLDYGKDSEEEIDWECADQPSAVDQNEWPWDDWLQSAASARAAAGPESPAMSDGSELEGLNLSSCLNLPRQQQDKGRDDSDMEVDLSASSDDEDDCSDAIMDADGWQVDATLAGGGMADAAVFSAGSCELQAGSGPNREQHKMDFHAKLGCSRTLQDTAGNWCMHTENIALSDPLAQVGHTSTMEATQQHQGNNSLVVNYTRANTAIQCNGGEPHNPRDGSPCQGDEDPYSTMDNIVQACKDYDPWCSCGTPDHKDG